MSPLLRTCGVCDAGVEAEASKDGIESMLVMTGGEGVVEEEEDASREE